VQNKGLQRLLKRLGRGAVAFSCLVPGVVFAQDSFFAPSPSVVTGFTGLTSIEVVDLDGDGDQDFLAANGANGQIVWFESDGNINPAFPLVHEIDNSIDNALHASAADIDGDGDLDVIASVDSTSGQIVWYRNDGGLPAQFSPVFLGQLSSGDIGARVNAARAGDIDGDGDTDIAVSFYVNQLQNQGHVVWFESNGAVNPTFVSNPLNSATGTLENVLDLQLADLDGNGALDIAAVSETPGMLGGRNRVVWWSNNGNANPVFQFQSIDTNLLDPVSLTIADLGGNPAPDLAVAAAGSGVVATFINSGTPAPIFTNVGAVTLGDPRCVTSADIDSDGDQDLVVALGIGLDAVVLESDGNFVPGFAQRFLGVSPAFCDAVAAGDVDSNGMLDVATVFPGVGRLDWFSQAIPIQNTTAGSAHANFTDAVAAASQGDSLLVAEDRLFRDPVIDLNGKGIEIVSDANILLGDQASLVLADGAGLVAQPGAVVELDGDIQIPTGAAVSIFSDSGSAIRTSLAVPSGSVLIDSTDLAVLGRLRFTQTTVDADTSLGLFQNLIGRPVSTAPIAIDNAGTTGFAIVGDEVGGIGMTHSAGLAVYAPDASSSTGWTGYPVDNSVDAIHGPLAVGDFNNDSIDDIATLRDSGGGVELRIHLGQSGALPNYVSTTAATGQVVQHLVSNDLDFDGDIDLVSGQGWFRNSGAAIPSFTFVPFPVVNSVISFGVVVCDFDLDGGRDVAIHCEKIDAGVVGRVGYQLFVLRSDAAPSPAFSPLLIQERDFVASGQCSGDFDCYPMSNIDLNGINTLSREDQNHDSLTDLFMSEDEGITLFVNLSSGFPMFASTLIDPGAVFCNVVPVDADGDQDIDLLAVSQRQSRLNLIENISGTNYRHGLAVRPLLRASSVSILGVDESGISHMAVVGTGHDRVEIVTYDKPALIDIKNGAGLTISGPLLIDNATVSMSGSQISSNGLVVSPTGVLEGAGVVQSSVENTGLVLPRTNLSVTGDLSQQSQFFPGERGVVEVQLRTKQDFDQLNVGGSVSLLGGLVALAQSGFSPTDGVPMTVITAGDIDNTFAMFEVVHAPKLSVLVQGDPMPGSFLPSYTDQIGGSSVDLIPTVVENPVLGRSDFSAVATPSDAVVFDITGGPDGLPDGFADTVVAYPRLPNGIDQGGLAVFLGGPGNKTRFGFESLSLYTGIVVNQPVAVEAGDFDGDGAIEIAFGNSLNFNQSDVFLLEADSSQQIPIFEASAPPLLLRRGAKILDLATSDFMPTQLRSPNVDFIASPIGLVVLTDSEDSGVATAAILSGPTWDGCDVDVCDDPDSVDPIDTDGAAGATLIEGYCATSNDDNKVVVASNPAASPGMFDITMFDVGDGPTELRADDMNDDGFPDIVTINELAGTVSVLINIADVLGPGGRGFDDHIELPLRLDPGDPDPLPSSVALADLDDDGDLDIAVVSTNEADERVVRQLQNLFVETGFVSYSSVVDLAEQPITGVPLLVREADLEGDAGAEMLNDDLVVFVEPMIGPLQDPAQLGFFQHVAVTSGVGPICVADVNGDGMLSPTDFTAWIGAFNTMSTGCDQNGDGLCTPTDFTAWIANYNAGCP
jgi:hypothetical protein